MLVIVNVNEGEREKAAAPGVPTEDVGVKLMDLV